MYKQFFVILGLILFSSLLLYHNVNGQSYDSTHVTQNDIYGDLTIISNTEGNEQIVHISHDQLLFDVTPHYDDAGKLVSFSLKLKPGLDNLYKDLGYFDKPKNTVLIYPSFTQAAYGKDGFYDFYNNKCDTKCLTVKIPNDVHGTQASSIAGAWVLKLLNYPYLKDEDVDKNPDVLKQYKRVIVLHNEYVTKKEFDAITSHPDVIFLYPNALYAEVQADYDHNTITLVKGHGYPESQIKNGFGWKSDNSKYEYDVNCDNWYFYKSAESRVMLNCYPEYRLLTSEQMLRTLHNKDAANLLDDINNWLRYPNDASSTTTLLNDYDVKGTHIPLWVKNSALHAVNFEITKTEFAHILRYLYDHNLLG